MNMKKIIFTALLTLSTIMADAQELVWYTDVAKATEASQAQKKPLMLFFTGSDWCGWCKRLQGEVFFTNEFKDWAKKNVIAVELDFPRTKPLAPEIASQNQNLQQMFGVRGYPTVWFVNSILKEKQISFEKLGSTGYVAGGPTSWIGNANSILAAKPKP